MQTSVVSGDAKLKEPNQILLSGNLEAFRIQQDRLEKVSSDSATVFFKAKNINELIHSAELDRSEIVGNVKILVNETELQTERAEFLGDKQTLVSKFPVLLTSPGKKVNGTEGFYLDVDRQEMELFGDIEGELQVDAKKH